MWKSGRALIKTLCMTCVYDLCTGRVDCRITIFRITSDIVPISYCKNYSNLYCTRCYTSYIYSTISLPYIIMRVETIIFNILCTTTVCSKKWITITTRWCRKSNRWPKAKFVWCILPYARASFVHQCDGFDYIFTN